MKVINSSRRLPESQLKVIAAIGWACVVYLCWVVVVDSWERTMFSFQAIAGNIPALDPFNDRYTANPRLTLLHTIPGILFAILGPLQFMSPIRRSVPAIHRLSGRIFVTIGIASGIGAFLLDHLGCRRALDPRDSTSRQEHAGGAAARDVLGVAGDLRA